MPRKQEHSSTSCRTILDRLKQCQSREKRLLLFEDMMWKTRNLPSADQWYYKACALACFAEQEVQKRVDFKEPEMKERKVDVAVVTVIQHELIAAKRAFGIQLSQQEDAYVNGLRFWEFVLNGSDGKPMNAVITMVGGSGNVSCAAACDRLFSTYDVDLCLLVGIAAGLKGKVKLGDVVASEIILDYENARLEPDHAKKRPRHFSPDSRLSRDLEYFNPRQHDWYGVLWSVFSELRKVPYHTFPAIENIWDPAFVPGVILAGEKLIADSSLDKKRLEFHDRVRAAEMEGAGFARLCEEHGVNWLVFRGISDYGDPDKPANDEWHVTAALAAATAARVFIEKGYKRPTRM